MDKTSGSKILIVDDEEDIVESLEVLLTKHGYQVVQAFDGDNGSKKALTEKPDLIVMDLTMAPISGYDACKIIKLDPRTRDIPILVLTATGMSFEGIEKTFACGADAYIEKPFKNDLLLTKIRNLLTGTDASQKLKQRMGH